ncbi:MAG: FAD-binding protein [Acidimicrobiia bacterium]|nr:FAD-binding protein [Acidimicrobiia bacterium]
MTTAVLEQFVDEVGDTGAVAVRGGGTQWDVGGAVDAAAREVRAPSGIVELIPEEMTVTVRAGTTVDELHRSLAEGGQRTALSGGAGTVGGALAVGRDTIHRRGRGLARDSLLQARYVSAEARLVTAGGPTVKNVSGFDLCRLLVGSLGTLGLLAELILRTNPVPAAARWLRVDDVDPHAELPRLGTASSVLWDGRSTWVHLEGHGVDVDAEADRLGKRFVGVDGPPELPPHRWSTTPRALAALDGATTGPFVAELGVGTVHATRPAPARPVDDGLRRLNLQVKQQFDPTNRLNPGRDPLRR